MAAASDPLAEQSEHPREEALALQALLALDRTYPRLWRLIEQQVADDVRLSRSEMRLLQGIPLDVGALAVELARDLQIDPGQLSRMLSRLTRRRLVAREPGDGDGRLRRITVSARGRRALAAIDRAAGTIAERTLGALSAVERRRLIDAAATISDVLAVHIPPR